MSDFTGKRVIVHVTHSTSGVWGISWYDSAVEGLVVAETETMVKLARRFRFAKWYRNEKCEEVRRG